MEAVNNQRVSRAEELTSDLELQESTAKNQEINSKISQVYAYFAAAFAATFASAVAFANTGFTAAILTMAGPVGTLLLVGAATAALLWATTKAEKGSGHKMGLFGMFTICEGLALSPLMLINSSAFIAASAATLALTGGLALLAVSLKDSFERYEKILMVALGAIALASLSTLILPVGAAAIAHEISMIGGFALFSCLIILETHEARSRALNPNFDPMHHAIGIYLDSVNLLVRLFDSFVKK